MAAIEDEKNDSCGLDCVHLKARKADHSMAISHTWFLCCSLGWASRSRVLATAFIESTRGAGLLHGLTSVAHILGPAAQTRALVAQARP